MQVIVIDIWLIIAKKNKCLKHEYKSITPKTFMHSLSYQTASYDLKL